MTGAGDGIGAAVARAYAAEGARVVVAELSEETGRAVADEIDGLFVRTDVGQRDQVEAMVQAALDTWGSVDILVNNAWGAATSVASRTRPTRRSTPRSRSASAARSGRCRRPSRT